MALTINIDEGMGNRVNEASLMDLLKRLVVEHQIVDLEVPRDGSEYGIYTGSPDEWANLYREMIEVESLRRTNKKGDIKNPKFNSYGLLQLSPGDAKTYNEYLPPHLKGHARTIEGDPKFTLGQLYNPEINLRISMEISKHLLTKHNVKKGNPGPGVIFDNLGEYWGTIKVPSTGAKGTLDTKRLKSGVARPIKKYVGKSVPYKDWERIFVPESEKTKISIKSPDPGLKEKVMPAGGQPYFTVDDSGSLVNIPAPEPVPVPVPVPTPPLQLSPEQQQQIANFDSYISGLGIQPTQVVSPTTAPTFTINDKLPDIPQEQVPFYAPYPPGQGPNYVRPQPALPPEPMYQQQPTQTLFFPSNELAGAGQNVVPWERGVQIGNALVN